MKTKINININKDDSELNDFLYCWGKFNTRPNKIIIYNSYSRQLFSEVISEYMKEKNVFTEVIPTEESLIINDKMLVKINEDFYISYLIVDRMNEDSAIHDIVFYFKNYDSELELVNELIDKLDGCLLDYKIEESCIKLNTLTLSQSGLDIESIDFNDIDTEDIELYYSKDTLKEVNQLIKNIKKSKKGLSVFYGPRGTGKTSMLKYLSEKVEKMVLFVPNNMMDNTINNPEFRKFLRKHHNPLLVIDDCEVVFSELFTRSNIFSSNLLQLIDGPLSDTLSLNVLLIFNFESVDEIDHSILECNSLLDVVEFDMLDEDQANDLANAIGSKKKYKTKTKLVDIMKKRNPSDIKKIGL